MNNRIVITFRGGEQDIWGPEDWDDYKLSDGFFIVKMAGDWVGIYNMHDIVKVVLSKI